MADAVEIVFGAKIDGAIAGISAVKNGLSSLTSTADSVSSSIKGIAASLGIGLSIAGVISFVNSMADLGFELERTADRLGISIEKVVQFDGLARLTGTDIGSFSAGIERMSFNIQRARTNALDPAAQGLKVLGLNAKDLVGIGTEQLFEKLSGAVEKFNPSLNLFNALMAVGGKTLRDMYPALSDGVAGWERYKQAINAASEGKAAAVAGMAETSQKISLLSLSIQSLGARVFNVLKPIIDAFIDSRTKMIQGWDTSTIVNAVTTIGNAVVSVMGYVGTFAINIMGLLDQLRTNLDQFASKASAAAGGMTGGAIGGGVVAGVPGAIVGGIGGGLAGWFGAEYGSADKAAAAGNEKMQERLRQLGELMLKFKMLVTQGVSNMNTKAGADPAKGEGDTASAMNLNLAAQQSAQAAAYDAMIARLQGFSERQKMIYQFDADTFQITQSRKTELMLAELDREYQAERAMLVRKQAIYAGQPEKVAEIQKQISQIEQSYQTARLRTEQEGIKARIAMMQEWVGALQSSFNGQLRGLLAGTTSWSQAFKTVLGDMIIFAIQTFGKMVAQWIVAKVAMATTTKAQAVEEVATAAAAQTAQTAVTISGIQQRVALVYAGAAAFFAPLLGPGAPAAAAAVATATEAGAVGLMATSAETGAYEVTGGLWKLHDKETVLPAPAAQAFRDMAEGNLGGGGGGLHFHGQFIDAQSISRFFRSNAGVMAQALRNNSQLSPG